MTLTEPELPRVISAILKTEPPTHRRPAPVHYATNAVKVPAGISEYRLQDHSPLNRNSVSSPMPLCAADPGEKKKGRLRVPKTKAVAFAAALFSIIRTIS